MNTFFALIKLLFQQKISLSIILLVFNLIIVKAQTKNVKGVFFDEQIYQQLIGKSYIDKSLVNKGIFFRNSFLPGKIIFTSGDSIDKVFIRYECLSEKLIWLSDGLGQVELDDLSIISFELRNADTTFFFSKRAVKALNDSSPRFYQVYPDSRLNLLALRKIVRKDSYMKKKKFYVYAPAPVFVFYVHGKEYVLKNTKLKSLYTLFPEKKEAIQKQLTSIPFRIKNENDFVAFLQRIEPIFLEKKS